MLSGTRRPAVFGAAAPDTSPASDAPITSSVPDAPRAFAVKLVFAIYILALIEGPLRKWGAPGLATPLYFLRDPLVLLLYAYCLHRRLVVFDAWTKLWFGFAAWASAIGVLPFVFQGIGLHAWGFGVRTYWLYMPLAFVIASTFTRADLLRFVHVNLLLAVPYAGLVILQYKSPVGAWINASIGDEDSIVTVGLGIVRPYGLFTFTGQNVIFSASLVALFVAALYLSEKTRLKWALYGVVSFAIAALATLSGSRSIYFITAFILLVTLGGSVLAQSKSTALRANMLVAACVALAAILFVNVFSDAFEAMQDRLERTERSEGAIQNRAFSGFLNFVEPLGTAPLLGHGIGLGTPALNRFLNRQQLEFGEGDLMRNVNELGPVNGLALVILRFAFAFYLLVLALRAARNGHLEVLPLAGFAALGIAHAQITHSTLNGFQYWVFAGLVLTALRSAHASSAPSAPPDRHQVVQQSPFVRDTDRNSRMPLFRRR